MPPGSQNGQSSQMPVFFCGIFTVQTQTADGFFVVIGAQMQGLCIQCIKLVLKSLFLLEYFHAYVSPLIWMIKEADVECCLFHRICAPF